MNWTKIKTVIIILLLGVNIFFGYSLYTQYNNLYSFDKEVINSVTELLKKDDIYIDINIIPTDKKIMKAYQSNFDEYYDKLVADQIFGTGNYSERTVNNETQYISKNYDILEVNNPDIFSIKYIKSGFDENNRTAPDKGMISELKKSELRNYTNIINRFLGFDNDNIITVNRIYYDAEQMQYILYCSQNIDSYKIGQCESTFIIKDNIVCYAAGTVIFFEYINVSQTPLIDQINILFVEKAYIDEMRGKNEPDYEKVTIISLELEYYIIWNNYQSNMFYLLPAWRIEYDNGITRIRIAVDGSIY